ncbi:MAG: nitrogen fixation-related uncharacterized protein [Planctomycetota bacterium]|jgi:nitrogen fixation-related uncharacterized protein
MNSQEKSESAPQYSKRFTRNFHIFFITVCTGAGCMFVFKLFSFMQTIKREEMNGFAFDPIMIYACVAAGFLILLFWAYLTGQFRNIEGPKYEMFERMQEQERKEFEWKRGTKSNE